jgi:predicted ATPase
VAEGELVGREVQTKALTEALHQVLLATIHEEEYTNDDDDNNPHHQHMHMHQGPQVVILQGESGSGKTHLLQRWWAEKQRGKQQQHEDHQQSILCLGCGKFDQKQTTSYGALVEVVNDLILQVDDRVELRKNLREALEDSELQLLMDFIPGIKGIMKHNSSVEEEEEEEEGHRSTTKRSPSSARVVAGEQDARSSVTWGDSHSEAFALNLNFEGMEHLEDNPQNGPTRSSLIRNTSTSTATDSIRSRRRSSATMTSRSSIANVRKRRSSAAAARFRMSMLNISSERLLFASDNKSMDASNYIGGDTMMAFKNPIERFAFVLGGFLMLLSEVLPPAIVIFIDDLQWADQNSLGLLQSLCKNPELSNILLVMANRPDTHLDKNIFPALKETVESTRRKWQKLSVDELDIRSCNIIVSKLTELREEKTWDLTQVCYTKTQGNPFFFLKFLESLQRRELLVYNMETFQFSWDVEAIKNETDLADNVAGIVLEGIQALDFHTQQCLRIASRLGFSFDRKDVATIMEGLKMKEEKAASAELDLDEVMDIDVSEKRQTEIDEHLHKAFSADLLDKQANDRYKFAHDQILQSFLGMKSTYAANEDLVLGHVLLSLFRTQPKAKEWALFGALQSLKVCSASLPRESQMALVDDHLLAATKAAKKSAFYEAAEYSMGALKLLMLASSDPWTEHIELCQSIHLMTARYSLACGKHDDCESVLKALLEHTAPNSQEKTDAYLTLACSLRNQSKIPDSIAVLTEALAEMGEKVPTSAGLITKKMSSNETKKKFGKLSDSDILNLPPIKDRHNRNKMRLFSTLFLNMYHEYQKDTMWLVLKRMLILTSEIGVCNDTPLILAAHAYHLTNKGDFTGGSHFGKLATKMTEKLNAKANLPIVTFFLVVFVNHLQKPMFKSLPLLKRGFKVGMEHGDSQAAFLCATTDVCYQFIIGSHLKDNCDSCANYFRIAHEYGEEGLKKEILLMWQLTSNLMGKSEDPTKFDGAVMNETELMRDIMESKKMEQLRFYCNYLRALGGVYLGQWEESSKIFEFVLSFDDKSHYSNCFSTVYGAVTWYKVLSTRKDAKLQAKAAKALSTLKGWVEKGAINLAAGLFFAEAQKAAIDKPFHEVKASFDKAIVGLHRCGLRNLAGLACQCFAEYALEKNDQEWASDYMKRARESYNGKVWSFACQFAVFFLVVFHLTLPQLSLPCALFLYARLGSRGCGVLFSKESWRSVKI